MPPARVDLKSPRIRRISLAKPVFRGVGSQLHFALGERAKLDAEYYRLGRNGKRKFAGWHRWNAYVGDNEVRFGGRAKHFDAAPGRYVAELRATDRGQNESPTRRVHFRISPSG